MDNLALKDIHLPASIGWWPPAIGWWLLFLSIIALLAGGYWLYRRLTRDTALKNARRLLSQLQQPNDDPLAKVVAMSALLRRVAISGNRRNQVAHLHGRAWLEFLDQGLSDTPFTTGIGQILADAHYRPSLPADFDLAALLALGERWLRQQEKRRC